jgi:hypothetical protein
MLKTGFIKGYPVTNFVYYDALPHMLNEMTLRTFGNKEKL